MAQRDRTRRGERGEAHLSRAVKCPHSSLASQRGKDRRTRIGDEGAVAGQAALQSWPVALDPPALPHLPQSQRREQRVEAVPAAAVRHAGPDGGPPRAPAAADSPQARRWREHDRLGEQPRPVEIIASRARGARRRMSTPQHASRRDRRGSRTEQVLDRAVSENVGGRRSARKGPTDAPPPSRGVLGHRRRATTLTDTAVACRAL